MRLPGLDTVLLSLWRLFIIIPCIVCFGALFYELSTLPVVNSRWTVLWFTARVGGLFFFSLAILYKTLQGLISTDRRRDTEGHLRDIVMKLSIGYVVFGSLSLTASLPFGLFLIGAGAIIFLIPERAARP